MSAMRSPWMMTVLLLLLLQACASRGPMQAPASDGQAERTGLEHVASAPARSPEASQERSGTRIEFSDIHPSFRFSAVIPSAWDIAFVPEINAINVYDPMSPKSTPREQSQIFIRFFEASQFLTLSTVVVHQREETAIDTHPAVRYEIEKKPAVPAFPYQPSWRSERHRLIDVRLRSASPSTFYVFAYHPSIDPMIFEAFLRSLRFHNDRESTLPPLSRASERVTKKPFALSVSPDRSPVQPERFSGFHTGTDFEVLDGEESLDIAVTALCGGKLRLKQRASGYGGVVVQECLLGDEAVTVLYGHLALHSVSASVGRYLAPGAYVGFLGAAQSDDTDGEREHLHLGIHRGAEIDLRGYVERQAALSEWIDPTGVF